MSIKKIKFLVKEMINSLSNKKQKRNPQENDLISDESCSKCNQKIHNCECNSHNECTTDDSIYSSDMDEGTIYRKITVPIDSHNGVTTSSPLDIRENAKQTAFLDKYLNSRSKIDSTESKSKSDDIRHYSPHDYNEEPYKRNYAPNPRRNTLQQNIVTSSI